MPGDMWLCFHYNLILKMTFWSRHLSYFWVTGKNIEAKVKKQNERNKKDQTSQGHTAKSAELAFQAGLFFFQS